MVRAPGFVRLGSARARARRQRRAAHLTRWGPRSQVFLTAFLALLVYIQQSAAADSSTGLAVIGRAIVVCCVVVLALVFYWAVSEIVDGVRLALAQLQMALDSMDRAAGGGGAGEEPSPARGDAVVAFENPMRLVGAAHWRRPCARCADARMGVRYAGKGAHGGRCSAGGA